MDLCGREKNKDNNPDEGPLLANHCFLNLASLQGVKEHKCGICGREFTLLANMKRHVLIHTNIRAYQCHLCYKSFVQKQTLKAHMIVHSDVKPFKCKVGRGCWESANREAPSEWVCKCPIGKSPQGPSYRFHQWGY